MTTATAPLPAPMPEEEEPMFRARHAFAGLLFRAAVRADLGALTGAERRYFAEYLTTEAQMSGHVVKARLDRVAPVRESERPIG